MTCHDVQLNLSLYLYGELDFSTEEALERHLDECAFCQRALTREKTWHTTASSEHRDVPLDLLAQCRQDLRTALSSRQPAQTPASSWNFHWPEWLRITPHRWSYQIALASLLVFVGFSAGRFVDRTDSGNPLTTMSFFPSATRIRDIQPNGPGRVRILLDQVNQREVVGSLDDQNVRRWVMVGVEDLSDPGIRVDSVDILGRQNSPEIRQILLNRLQRDPNAAVRLKALESVRRFSDDPDARVVLRSVLEHDADPAVRSEAIDVLAPLNSKPQISPELAATLQVLVRSERDDYVRARYLHLLHLLSMPTDTY